MRFATPAQYGLRGWGESTAAIVAMGVALSVAGIVQTLETPAARSVVAFELFASFVVPTGLATGGYWLARRNVSPRVRSRVAIWVSVGIVGGCAVGAWLIGYVTLQGGSVRGPLLLETALAAVGGTSGFVAAICATRWSARIGTNAAEGAGREESADASVETSASTRAEHIDRDGETDGPSPAIATRAVGTGSGSVPVRCGATDAGLAGTGPRVYPDASVEPGAHDGARRPSTPAPASAGGVEAVASVPSTAETVLEVLGNERTRTALAILYHDRTAEGVSVDELARAVAAHVDSPPDAVATSLRHSSLPRLRAIRAVDWDPCAGRVSASEHAVFEEGVREAAVLLESFEPGIR